MLVKIAFLHENDEEGKHKRIFLFACTSKQVETKERKGKSFSALIFTWK